MNAEQVVDKILSEANTEADKIKAGAREKADGAQTELESQLADYRKETGTLAVEAGEDKTNRMLATARMEIRKQKLAKKVSLLDEVFVKAREQLKSLGDDDYRSLMKALMVKCIETGDEEVLVGKEDGRIDHDFLKHVNRELGAGFKGNLQLSNDRANIDGGFILRRGKIQINVSLDVLITQAREALEMELTTELFGV